MSKNSEPNEIMPRVGILFFLIIRTKNKGEIPETFYPPPVKYSVL